MPSTTRFRPGTLSLNARLTLLYALVTSVVLVCATLFQLFALEKDLEFEDNDFIVEKLRLIESIVASAPEHLAPLTAEVGWESSVRQGTRYFVRILDQQQRLIVETAGTPLAFAVERFPAPAADTHSIGRGAKIPGVGGKTFLLNAAWIAAAGNPHHRLVQVALDVSDEEELLVGYRRKLVIAFGVGLLLVTVGSSLLVRRALRPLREITAVAERVTATQLHDRLQAQVWPRELASLAAAFDAMLERLESSFARLNEFSADLAHELRTPLHVLRGEAEVALSQSRDAAEYRRVLESGLEEYQRLTRMIDDILFLARNDRPAEPVTCDGRAELERLCAYYGTLAEEQGISLDCSGAGEIRVDLPLFQRAVGNLLSNALRYTPNGGRIQLTLERAADGATLVQVRDSGIGIPAAQLPRIFDRFYRSEQARQRYAQGSGLGLAIVRSIMELHGGSVQVESEANEGTTVTLRFP